jgi:hypothetical protein
MNREKYLFIGIFGFIFIAILGCAIDSTKLTSSGIFGAILCLFINMIFDVKEK